MFLFFVQCFVKCKLFLILFEQVYTLILNKEVLMKKNTQMPCKTKRKHNQLMKKDMMIIMMKNKYNKDVVHFHEKNIDESACLASKVLEPSLKRIFQNIKNCYRISNKDNLKPFFS